MPYIVHGSVKLGLTPGTRQPVRTPDGYNDLPGLYNGQKKTPWAVYRAYHGQTGPYMGYKVATMDLNSVRRSTWVL